MSERATLQLGADNSALLSGELTFESVPALYREMEQRLRDSGPICDIDLTGVGAVDSAGLALLLEWQARQRARGRELTMRQAPDNLMRLARLCESVDLLRLSPRDVAQ